MERNCIAQCTCVSSSRTLVDVQGDGYMARNCAIENGWVMPKGLYNHQHCEVLMGQDVAES